MKITETLARDWASRGRVPPILLLTGQSGVGKTETASELAKWLLCKSHGFFSHTSSPDRWTACGQCDSCLKIHLGNSTELIEISSDSADESLKIDRFRELKAKVGWAIEENRFQVVLIPRADRMTPQAANSVLKLLEEPPRGWIFFLTANDPSLLLPTLVSRCQILRLKPLPNQSNQNRLKSEEAFLEKRQLLIQLLTEPSQVITSLIDWASQETAHFEQILDILENVAADLICWSAFENEELYPWRQTGSEKELKAHALTMTRKLGSKKSARQFWIQQAERCFKARQEILAPLNKKLVVQDILLPWLEGQP